MVDLLFNDQMKKTWFAYVLLFTFGFFGAHRYYLQSLHIAAFLFISNLIMIFSVPFFIWVSYAAFAGIVCILIFDLIFIPSMVRVYNIILLSELRDEYHGRGLNKE